MLKFLANPRFLAAYSGLLTVVFVLTVSLEITHGGIGLLRVSRTEQHDKQHADFDQLTVHRINVVEPDGTPRLVISDKAEFPGEFFKGRELARLDRQEAGMLFMNDEGTENGGMLFGGYQSSDGKLHSSGHLSFDEYEQDQTLSMDTFQDGETRETAYQINDNDGATLMTPDVIAAFAAVHEMPEGTDKQKALAAVAAKYQTNLRGRASIERDADKSAALRLRDPDGHTRILLRVAPDGTPTMQFLDAAGKVTHQWPGTPDHVGPRG
jgi:regulator of RNase E activity RraB